MADLPGEAKQVWGWVDLTPWGWLGVASTAWGLKRVIWPSPTRQEVEDMLAASYGPWIPDRQELGQLTDKLGAALAGEPVEFNERLDLRGLTPFRIKVLQWVQAIPRGQVASYCQVALGVRSPRAARAVGQAMAKNPLPLVVPCHRVVGRRGPGGFGPGLSWKLALLAREGIRLVVNGPK